MFEVFEMRWDYSEFLRPVHRPHMLYGRYEDFAEAVAVAEKLNRRAAARVPYLKGSGQCGSGEFRVIPSQPQAEVIETVVVRDGALAIEPVTEVRCPVCLYPNGTGETCDDCASVIAEDRAEMERDAETYYERDGFDWLVTL